MTNCAQCYKAMAQYKKCFDMAERAAEKDPKNVKAYYLQGTSLMMLSHQSDDDWKSLVKKGIGFLRTGTF